MLVDEMPVAAIRIGANRRALNPLKVAELVESIQESGLLNPPTVTEDGALIAGLHRIKACEQLGWMSIPVIKAPLSGVSAELAEIDENLVRNDLTVMERGEHLGRRQELYEALHPKVKHGGDRRSEAARSSCQNGDLKTPTFVEATAAATGLSTRTIHREVQIAESIAPDVKEIIRNTDVADSKTDLLALARMEPEEQREVVAVIQSGKASTVRDAKQSQAMDSFIEQEVAKEIRKIEAENPGQAGGEFKPQVLWEPPPKQTPPPKRPQWHDDAEDIAICIKELAESTITAQQFKDYCRAAFQATLDDTRQFIPQVVALLEEIAREP